MRNITVSVTSIARIQHRRGAKTDLPLSLYEGEFGWCLDTRELYIGNGLPFTGNTQILTEFSSVGDVVEIQWNTISKNVSAGIQRSLAAKLNDSASVQDFGAIADGTTDNAPLINNAIAALFGTTGARTSIEQNTQVTLRLPAGVYNIKSPLLLYPNLNLIGDGPNNTIILVSDNSMTYAVETADSKGQTDANIGGTGGDLPANISVKNLTINTNGYKIDAVHLTRYRRVQFENVEFIGGYVPGAGGDLGLYPNAAVVLATSGAAVPIYDASFTRCQFSNFTYVIYANDPVSNTVLHLNTIDLCWRGLNFGEFPVDNGPSGTILMGNKFTNLDSWAIFLQSSNPGISSMGNIYTNIGVAESTQTINWDVGTNGCSSMGEFFSTSPAIADAGTGNIILNSQENNQSSWP